jgi:carbon storage regulator
MLVLSRKPGEALRVGEEVEITVVEVKGDMVRLGIQAPRDVQVWRKELWEAIVAENIKAAEEAAASVTMAMPVPALPVPTASVPTVSVPAASAPATTISVAPVKTGVSDLLAKKKKK